MTVFASAHVTIAYIAKKRLLHITWYESTTFPDVISVVEWIVDKSKSIDIDYLLTDLHKYAFDTNTADHFLTSMNCLFENGIKGIFHVVPLRLYTGPSADNLFKRELEASERGKNIKYFANLSEAMKNINDCYLA